MQTYPQSPYYQGRWSNGPVWIEIAARQLGVNLTDFGAAGATTGVVPAREILTQISNRCCLDFAFSISFNFLSYCS